MLREGCALCLVFLLERSEWRVPDRAFLRPACRRHHGQGPENEARSSPCLHGAISRASMRPSFNAIRVSARKYSLKRRMASKRPGLARHGDLQDGTRIAGIHGSSDLARKVV